MKRLAMIMAAALMLIFSVGGLAETIPEKIDITQYKDVAEMNADNVWVNVVRGRGDSTLFKRGDSFRAHYSFGGELLSYVYTHEDGCEITYSRDGSVFMDDYYKKDFGPDHGMLFWVNGKWSVR